MSSEAGQVGMVLVNANVSGDFNDEDVSNDDPVAILQKMRQSGSPLFEHRGEHHGRVGCFLDEVIRRAGDRFGRTGQ